MDEQNKKYGNDDIVDRLDVLDLTEVCEKRISRHELFLCQTTKSLTIPGNGSCHILHTYTTKSHTNCDTYGYMMTLNKRNHFSAKNTNIIQNKSNMRINVT